MLDYADTAFTVEVFFGEDRLLYMQKFYCIFVFVAVTYPHQSSFSVRSYVTHLSIDLHRQLSQSHDGSTK